MTDSDRRSTLVDSYENAAVIVSGIAADELGHPTPCPGYDVAGLIDHLVEAGHRAAALGRGQAPPPGDESPHVELCDAPGQSWPHTPGTWPGPPDRPAGWTLPSPGRPWRGHGP